MQKKLLFFLRAYNDIDHIVPVIYKWLSVEAVPVDVVITRDRSSLTDYRINFLKQYKHFRLFHITDFLPEKSKHKQILPQVSQLLRQTPLRLISHLMHKGFQDLPKHKTHKKTPPLKQDPQFIETMLDILMKDIKQGIVVLDWTFTNFARTVTEAARKRDLVTVALPHGDSPYYNRMETQSIINYKLLTNIFAMAKIYDYVVVPNKLCARRFEPHLEPSRIKILGSPRYNNEWLKIISDLLPEFNHEKGYGKLKIVFFMRDLNYSIFYEELVTSIKLLLQFPDVYVVRKYHTRNVERMIHEEHLKGDMVTAPNLETVYNEVHSESLLKWADVVMDLGTSIAFEAVKRRIPVLCMEYLHPNYSTVAHYIKASEIKCRDHLYDAIEAFLKNPKHPFYNEEERKHFIRNMIDVPDGNVLDRYVQFLKDCL